MAIGEITNPYEFFTNADGTPLEAGQIYIGVDGLDPQDNPQAAYFDLAGTIGATQPIRTLGGYPVNAGSATKIFTDGSFSVKVLDENNNLVYTDLSVSQIVDDVDAVTARVDDMAVPFDTVADFFAATLAEIKTAANATTGTAYVEVKDGGHRYSVDLSQGAAFDWETGGGVEISFLKNEDGNWYLDAFAGVGQTGDITAAWQLAISIMDPYEKLIFPSGGRYTVSDEIGYTSPLTTDLNGSMVSPDPAYTGYMVSVSGTRRGISDLFWQHPMQGNTIPGRTLGDNNGFTMVNGIFDGNYRQQDSNGIIFRGGNSDAYLGQLNFFGIKGHALVACDPDGTVGDDADNQYMQESDFEHLHMKNCGDTGKPMCLIGRNNNGASNHNNLRFFKSSFIYPREAEAIRVENKNTTTTSGNIQSLRFVECFMHGNESVVASDNYSQPTADVTNLVHMVANTTGLAKRILRADFIGCRIIEQGDGFSALYAKGVENLSVQGGDITAASGRVGIELENPGATLITNVLGLSGEDGIKCVGSPRSAGALTIGPLNQGALSDFAGPNFSWSGIDLSNLKDVTAASYTHTLPEDATAATTTGVTLIASLSEEEVIVGAWYTPLSAVTTSDTNYARILLRIYSAAGTAVGSAAETQIKLSESGNLSALVPYPLNINEGMIASGSIGFNIAKNGSGLQLPTGVLTIRTSKQLYIAVS